MIKINKRILLISILIILLLIIFLNISMIRDLTNITELLNNSTKTTLTTGSPLHIALIYLDNGKFTDLLIAGAKKTAQKEKIDLKIYPVKFTEQLKLKDYFQLTLLAKFDGIILDGESPDLIPLINKVQEENIPVVTILSDLPNSARISYIGINNHQAGFMIGRAMLKNFSKRIPNLAIISTDYTQNNSTPTAEYLKIFGFKEAISSNPDARIISWTKAKPNLVDSLQTISKMIKKHPEINGIFTTQSITTIAAANVIANNPDRNISLIGYGDTEEIRQYIKKGIIKASVVINSYQIGSNAVKEISTYCKEKKVNLYSNINIKLLTSDQFE